METHPSYDTLSALLDREDLTETPAELQGRLSAQLSVNPGIEWSAWVSAALGPEFAPRVLAEDLEDALRHLFTWTLEGLSDPQLGFVLFLPDDDESLQYRTEALATWCQGFVAGLSQCGVGPDTGLAGDAGEYLDDLSEISQADFGTEGSEDDEVAYTELVEYARVGAMFIFATLHGPVLGETVH
ncbi:MAG: UPF0149 family protein [Xanthomonadales bacterium]|nr:UPF0149 family protein [Xanthomonadales bacterium]